MSTLLSEAGRSFLRAFGGSLVVLLPGILSAPTLHGVAALGIAAIIASLAAGLKAIQVFVPQLSFKSIKQLGAYYVYADSFARAFIAAFITAVVGILVMPTFSVSTSLIIAVVVGAVTAGIRAVQGLLTPGEVPSPQSGIKTPGA